MRPSSATSRCSCKSGDVALRERLVFEVGEWWPAPQRQCLAEPLTGARRISGGQQPAAVGEQALEAEHVDVVGTDLGDVAVAARQHERSPLAGACSSLRNCET